MCSVFFALNAACFGFCFRISSTDSEIGALQIYKFNVEYDYFFQCFEEAGVINMARQRAEKNRPGRVADHPEQVPNPPAEEHY